MILFLSFLAAAIVGGFVAYLLEIFLPDRPAVKHIITVACAVIIFVFVSFQG